MDEKKGSSVGLRFVSARCRAGRRSSREEVRVGEAAVASAVAVVVAVVAAAAARRRRAWVVEGFVENREATEHFWRRADSKVAPVLYLGLGDPCCRSLTQVASWNKILEGRLGQTGLVFGE